MKVSDKKELQAGIDALRMRCKVVGAHIDRFLSKDGMSKKVATTLKHAEVNALQLSSELWFAFIQLQKEIKADEQK